MESSFWRMRCGVFTLEDVLRSLRFGVCAAESSLWSLRFRVFAFEDELRELRFGVCAAELA